LTLCAVCVSAVPTSGGPIAHHRCMPTAIDPGEVTADQHKDNRADLNLTQGPSVSDPAPSAILIGGDRPVFVCRSGYSHSPSLRDHAYYFGIGTRGRLAAKTAYRHRDGLMVFFSSSIRLARRPDV
jgi:hypothetical protein